MFDGVALEFVDLGEVTLRVRHGGSGDPLPVPPTALGRRRVAPLYGVVADPSGLPRFMAYCRTRLGRPCR